MRKCFLITLFAIGGLVLATNVFALTISPPVFEVGGNPGDTIRSEIKLFNETDSEVTVWTSTADFGAKEGEGGEPSFYAPEEKEEDLASWIQIESGPITLSPRVWRTISFKIKIPSYADPGGHYAAIFFGDQPPEEAGTIGVASKLGTLVLLRASGEIHEEGSLVEFSLKEEKKFYEHLPIDFVIRFKNSGNVHLKPQGEMEITNIFRRTSDVVDVNKVSAGGNVLPDSIRKYQVSWNKDLSEAPTGFWDEVKAEKNNFALGRYTANLNLKYGADSKSTSDTLKFWVIPWHFLLVLGIGLIILIIILVFGIKRYNRWIVKKAMSQTK